MGLYKFIAVSGGEGPREMLIEADGRNEAVGKLRSRNLRPVRFLGEVRVEGSRTFSFRKTGSDVFSLTRQLAPLLNSFIPLERALSIIAEGADTEKQRDFVNSLRQGLHEGKKFSELVRSHGTLFPDYYANLIESGEESGCLPEVLNQLYKFMGESRDLKNFIVSSSIYPLCIFAVILIVITLMFTVFVPKFATVFEDMGREMPPSMVFLMSMSAVAKWAWWGIPAAIFAFRLILKHSLGAEELRWRTARTLLKLPLLGRILTDLEMCRYVRTLSIMISNHVEIIRTVRISGRIIHNPVIANAFRDLADKLKGGSKLSAALAGNKFVPREMSPMLRVGEESGTVGEMLERISDNLEQDTRRKIKQLLSLFEPAVILFLAAVVLVVVASIFTAMMDINAIS